MNRRSLKKYVIVNFKKKLVLMFCDILHVLTNRLFIKFTQSYNTVFMDNK